MLTIGWARGHVAPPQALYTLLQNPPRASLRTRGNGVGCRQRAPSLWIRSLKCRIEPGTCSARDAEQALRVLQDFTALTDVVWGERLWCTLPGNELLPKFSGMPSAYGGRPAELLSGEACCGSPSVWLAPDRCLQQRFADRGDRQAVSKHQGAWKQNDFNINLQHH